ncbi:MAG: hypothetical protein KGL39_42930 [Patescibacteria group bacterium]|nr:hypothetical protein [Patescibacteria group bacterium]
MFDLVPPVVRREAMQRLHAAGVLVRVPIWQLSISWALGQESVSGRDLSRRYLEDLVYGMVDHSHTADEQPAFGEGA